LERCNEIFAMNLLVAATIHDVKNTLNVLSTWLTEARREAPSRALDEARAAAARLDTQLVKLLALYRAGEGNLRLAIEDHDLADFCADVGTELVLPPGEDQRIVTDAGNARRLGAWAFDAYQVKLTLQDALRNALRHGAGAVNFTVSAEPGGGIRFTVSDDGSGFPPEVLSGELGAMNEAGSGLGLSFAQLIAQHHRAPDGRRGRLRLDNHPHTGGAVFSLILP